MTHAATSSNESITIMVDTRDQPEPESNTISVDTRPHYVIWTVKSNLTGPDGEFTATPYADGIPNILKYAFNLDGSHAQNQQPISGDHGFPSLQIIAIEGHPVIHLRTIRRKNDPNLTYAAEFSSSTSPWDHTTSLEPIEIIPINDVWEQVLYRDPIMPAVRTRRFGRIRVSYSDP